MAIRSEGVTRRRFAAILLGAIVAAFAPRRKRRSRRPIVWIGHI